jgi:hypothetical protein
MTGTIPADESAQVGNVFTAVHDVTILGMCFA